MTRARFAAHVRAAVRAVAGIGAMLGAVNAWTATGAPAAVPTQLAWLHDDTLTAVQRDAAAPEAEALRTPLGSVWKLFVYGYLASTGAHETRYRCDAVERHTDDEYCCDPGGSVGRDEALRQSCGPYFEPRRLHIAPADWSRFWQAQAAPAWLRQLSALQSGTQVSVHELLQALARLPAPARRAAGEALLPLNLREPAVLNAWGSGPRFKTWSWHLGAQRAGGAAGWLADGTPFWLGAAGTSRNVLQAQAPWVAAQWDAHGLADMAPEADAALGPACVDVRFFARYPLRSVRGAAGQEVAPGPLRGRLQLRFANGQTLAIDALPAMQLHAGAEGPLISGRFTLDDYVARVIDREGEARDTAAARALAVTARSYLLQNAPRDGDCLTIADDSRTQRVSPNPPSDAALAAARFTEGLVLQGAPVHYHSTQASTDVMSWQQAVQASRQGQPFDAILRKAYPGRTLAGFGGRSDCEPMDAARQWLVQREPRWRVLLHDEAGYEPMADALQVCRLAMGVPYSDQRTLQIHLREWFSREGRVTLIHEYLHLAFRHHPHGRDEAFVEQLAQKLVDS